MGKSDLYKKAKHMYSVFEDLPINVIQWAQDDGAELASIMARGYRDYVETEPMDVYKSTYVSKKDRSENEDASKYNWEHMTPTPKQLADDTETSLSGATPYSLPAPDGCNCGIRGRDVAFYEYGTGTAGEQYSDEEVLEEAFKAGWSYNTGAYVTNNAHEKRNRWYASLVNYPNFAEDFVYGTSLLWIYKGFAMMGIAGGGFCYQAIREYREALLTSKPSQQSGGYSTIERRDGSKVVIKLSRGSVNQYITDAIKNI